jgi:hypothetical protein
MGAYRFGAIMLLGWLLISTSFPLLAGNSPGLLITEVYYNSPGQDHEEEWIELTNFGSQLVDLAAYKIGDEETRGGGEGMLQFPRRSPNRTGTDDCGGPGGRRFPAALGFSA